MDETTDQSSLKQCCFTAVVYDENTNKVEHLFLDMVELSSGTAKGLYDCLHQMLRNKNISIENMVGFSSDTTNVMVGEHCSVFALLKKDLPHIALVKCSCHMIHLSSSKACLKLPRNVEDFLRSVGAHFSRSSQRQLKFREFQEFFQVEIHKILTPAQTRWLSLKACIDRVLKQYTPLKAYLTETVFSDPSKTTEEMLITMNNQFTVVYLEFMSYVLALVTKFNVLFQSETSLLYKLKPEVENLLKTLSSNFMKISYIKSCANILNADFKNPTHFLSLNEIYIGLKAGESIEILKNDENVPRAAIADFYRTCQEFYIELTSDITKRFDFGDPLFSIISAVNPSEAQQFLIKSLVPVLKRFPVLYKFVTAQKLDDEWRTHALLDFEQHGLEIHGDNINAESYWGKVFRLKNAAGEYMFPNIKIVMSLLLILPFSNASVERKFRALRCLKTENRNRLNTVLLTHYYNVHKKCGFFARMKQTFLFIEIEDVCCLKAIFYAVGIDGWLNGMSKQHLSKYVAELERARVILCPTASPNAGKKSSKLSCEHLKVNKYLIGICSSVHKSLTDNDLIQLEDLVALDSPSLLETPSPRPTSPPPVRDACEDFSPDDDSDYEPPNDRGALSSDSENIPPNEETLQTNEEKMERRRLFYWEIENALSEYVDIPSDDGSYAGCDSSDIVDEVIIEGQNKTMRNFYRRRLPRYRPT
ncbi:unnamed protein product [Parnassius apollo]|uniref:(apollo) hypothetical protein n=1 Tax=Parnassius apollo TaxID=110799 RepID=A0A8S3W5W1_PARAO|nr:unnamed protein product [Parnassius apollo]